MSPNLERDPSGVPTPTSHWLGELMSPADEAESIRRWAGGDSDATRSLIYTLLNNQFNVIYQRAQTLLTFSGLVITVTGFSGRTIAQTSTLAQASIVAGMALVLAGAAVAILFTLRVGWLSRRMALPGDSWITAILEMRNRKIRALRIASILVTIGFLIYGFSIALMLLDPHKVLTIPARP